MKCTASKGMLFRQMKIKQLLIITDYFCLKLIWVLICCSFISFSLIFCSYDYLNKAVLINTYHKTAWGEILWLSTSHFRNFIISSSSLTNKFTPQPSAIKIHRAWSSSRDRFKNPETCWAFHDKLYTILGFLL